jgi:hypothetical protein
VPLSLSAVAGLSPVRIGLCSVDCPELNKRLLLGCVLMGRFGAFVLARPFEIVA